MNTWSKCPVCGKLNDHTLDAVSPVKVDGWRRYVCASHTADPEAAEVAMRPIRIWPVGNGEDHG